MRKNIVKKTLAAGMLALMTCMSMNAMAAPEWVRVANPKMTILRGTPYEFTAEVTSFEDGCRLVAEKGFIKGFNCTSDGRNCLSYVRVESFGSCIGSFPSGKLQEYAAGYGCEKGITRYEGYKGLDAFGCWERIDCDPSLYARQGMPEACNPKPEPEYCPPKFPQNPEECSIAEKGFDFGGVVCNKDGSPFKDGSMFKVCIWPENIGYLFKTEDCQAQEIIARCISQHEQKHIDYGGICSENNRHATARYEDLKTDGYKLEESEIIAYHDTMACLADMVSTCKTTACREGIKDAGDVVSDKIVGHLTRWEQWNRIDEGVNAVSIPSDYYYFSAIDVNK